MAHKLCFLDNVVEQETRQVRVLKSAVTGEDRSATNKRQSESSGLTQQFKKVIRI